jgi:hypothetical protein
MLYFTCGPNGFSLFVPSPNYFGDFPANNAKAFAHDGNPR